MKDKITQSFIKDMRSFLSGSECGNLIREKWINGRLLDDASDAMRVGSYTEFITTGALPKNGKVPQAEFMASKKGRTVADMYVDYREAHANKDRIVEVWDKMGLVIAKGKDGKLLVGLKLTKGRFEGTIDVVLEATRDIEFDSGFVLKKGDRFATDMKISGLLEDKWSVHGWAFALGMNGGMVEEQKIYHGTQAKQYHYISDLPFFFMVVDPKGKYIRFFRIILDNLAIENHIAEGNDLHEKLLYYDQMDALTPRPEFSKCETCPLKGECNDKHTFPHPVDVVL